MRDYVHRFYRSWMQASGLLSCRVTIKESDLFIWAQRDVREEARASLAGHREELEDFIALQPLFAETFLPYEVPADAPEIVRLMAAAAKKTGVGPMAAVAGAIAELVGRDLIPLSPEIMVENGGDIYLHSARERRIGVFAGDSPLSGRLVIVVPPTPPGGLGVCTSSASVGPSYSAGAADAALVVAESAALADAAATALGNRAKGPEHIEDALSAVSGIEGVWGCLLVMGERLGVKGDLTLEGV
ncbi:MAG: UPF0280 family protein [Actinobacteria bacterium]|nr:UPF0280 family protein [Actinomycetota bacterium]